MPWGGLAEEKTLKKIKEKIVLTCLIYYLIYLAAQCGMQELSSPTKIKPVSPAVEAWSPNHWTARDFPREDILKYSLDSLAWGFGGLR